MISPRSRVWATDAKVSPSGREFRIESRLFMPFNTTAETIHQNSHLTK